MEWHVVAKDDNWRGMQREVQAVQQAKGISSSGMAV
jgi:hypothetical protein